MSYYKNNKQIVFIVSILLIVAGTLFGSGYQKVCEYNIARSHPVIVNTDSKLELFQTSLFTLKTDMEISNFQFWLINTLRNPKKCIFMVADSSTIERMKKMHYSKFWFSPSQQILNLSSDLDFESSDFQSLGLYQPMMLYLVKLTPVQDAGVQKNWLKKMFENNQIS